MNNFTHRLIFIFIFGSSIISNAQIIGGRDNSQASPKVAEASKLNGGSYSGDVNNMTGAFQSSINLGSVATPGGLGFSLNLSHSSSFSFSTNQPTSSGIPYGDGWNLSLPTISVETDIFHAFGAQAECNDNNGPSNQNTNKIENPDKLYEGDVFWFSPTINIPGVGGGSAVFKYVDDDDAGCAVFVLNTFESPLEIRFYGNNWTVSTANGTVYVFESGMTSYRAPSNKRFIDYDEMDVTSQSSAGGDELVNVPNTFPYGPSLQNVIEPKMDFGLWYCSRIYNPNLPGQNIIFTYERFGEFDFFQEFSQENYSLVHSDIIDDVSQNFHYTPSFKCYKDILLKKVESWVVDGTPLDILELEYRSLRGSDYNANGTILDPYDIGHTRLDSLYTSKVVSNDSINPFTQWVKYAHANQLGNNQTGINSSNPYVDLSGNYHPSYNNSSTINFDHSILESPRLMAGGIQGIGDVFEIRTKIVGSTGISDLKNGNGTVDIALVTARNATTVASGVALAPTTQTNFNDSRGTKLFSTFNSAMKWTRGNVDGLHTSNFFVMPNLPSDFKGFNIQVGPGNSEIDYSYNDHLLLNATYTVNPPTITNDDNNALAAYPQLTAQGIKSSATIPQNFGIGLPWGMMAPVFNTMSLANVNPLPDFELLYINTWSAPLLVGGGISPKHNPTKLNNTVELEEFELIRYSKNAYMLQGVKQYRVNGETNDNITTGKILVTQKQLKYTNKNLKGIKNKAYEQGVTIEIDSNFNRVIFLLSQIDEVPLDGELFTTNYGLTNTDEILSTYLEYENILPTGTMTYNESKPYQGLTHYALTKYIDQLGGETSITYYPITAPETRLVSNFLLPQTCFGSNTNRPYGTDKTFTAHLAVQFIEKKVENYVSGSGLTPIERKMEYVYDLTKRIYNRQQIEVPAENFRGTYSHKYDLAFGKTTVYTPALEGLGGNTRNYTVYEYYGEQIGSFTWGHNVSEVNYILYGKPKSVKSYDYNDVLHQETIYNYAYTLAAIDGYDRPNFVRDGISLYDHLAFRDYEYKDYYKNETITFEVNPSTILTGDEAKIASAPKSFAQPFFMIDRPKYLPFYFHNRLREANTIIGQDGEVTTSTQVNPDYLFNSYFVKKISEINRTYENGLMTELSPLNPGLPTSIIIGNNPNGTMPVNSVANNLETDQEKLDDIRDQGDDYITELRSYQPVSDTVLKAVIYASNISEPNKFLILNSQANLSANVWKSMIDQYKKFSSNSLTTLIGNEAYFDDEIQHYIISKTGSNAYPGARDQLSSVFLEDIMLKNSVFSDNVILDFASSSNAMPGISYKTILETQTRQLSQSLLQTIIESVNFGSRNAVDILRNQSLDDVSYKAVIDNSNVDNWTLVEVIEETQFDPSDSVIYYYINERSPSAQELQKVVDKVNREFGEFLITFIGDLYIGSIIHLQLNVNPLAVNCGNTVHTNRTYIETVKEFEYYEADYRGRAIGKAYELLMGQISSIDEPSSFPKTFDPQLYYGFDKTVTSLQLKHEPSWQVFSVTTRSPHLPGAKSREEYFYLYDLQNKYDRVWYNFDLSNGLLYPTIADFGGSIPADTFIINDNWDSYYEGMVPLIPEFDGMFRTRQYKNKSLAFQKTSFSKNVADPKMIRRSEYYDYDSRWRYDDLKEYAQAIDLGGEPCPPVVDPCAECILYNHMFNQDLIEMYLPAQWCAYEATPNSGYTYDYWFCPANEDITVCDPDANPIATACNESSGYGGPGQGFLVLATQLTKSLQLRSVSIQVDSIDLSVEHKFDNYKMDPLNQYIAEFELGDPTDMDENNFAGEYKMILPLTNLMVRTIDERNRHFQTELEHNQVDLKTRYYYDRAVAQTYQFACPQENYSTNINTNIGLPTRITVGYELPDSLPTVYEYTDAGKVSKVIEPSGKYSEYTFDNFNRLIETGQNGERILANYAYNYWDDELTDNFIERTEKNYVTSTIFNSNSTNDFELRRAYMDPVGRAQSIISSYITGNTINHIYSGSSIYDNWDRVIQAHKNYVVTDDISQNPSAINPNFTPNYVQSFGSTYYENTPKSRAVRASNYGVDIDDISDHVVRTTFDITNNIFASCELGLTRTELYQVMSSASTQNFRFFRVKTLDQDNKESIEYTNALGQKIGTIKKNDSEKIVTLFIYDSYGNLSKVINPAKQENTYTFNILGQLVIENTPDAGQRKYMYNKQGLVSVSLDQQGWKNEEASVASPFYRVFAYDVYGRLQTVGRSDGPTNYKNYKIYGPLHYKTAKVNENQVFPDDEHSPPWTYIDYTYTNASSQDWLANYKSYETLESQGYFSDHQVKVDNLLSQFPVTAFEKETIYGNNSNLLLVGKVIETNSYNNDGAIVQRVTNDYDAYGNLSYQRIYFNPDQQYGAEVFPQVSGITYPKYNYRGAFLEEIVDVDINDGIADVHYFYSYDPLNRLTQVAAAGGIVSSVNDATVLVSYAHDDANGLVSLKTHSVDHNGMSENITNIGYYYDLRDRLTEMYAQELHNSSGPLMMAYQLFYDDQDPYYDFGQSSPLNYSKNWNGNINGVLSGFEFDCQNCPTSSFQDPLLYGYSYDNLNRLTRADAMVGDYLINSGDQNMIYDSYAIGDVMIDYDKIGNIKYLSRGLKSQTPGVVMDLEEFNYSYQGGKNRLNSVSNGGYSRNYTYDFNGNLLTDSYRTINSTEYGRAAYAYEIVQTQAAISYLYSIDDQRMYKKVINSTETKEEYYLSDAMGKVVALQSKVTPTVGTPTVSKEFYVHGAEREARLVNSDSDVRFGAEEVSFFVYDHLGNTRLNYTPVITDIPSSSSTIIDDQFENSNVTDGWSGLNGNTIVSNPSGGALIVSNSVNLPVIQKPITILQGASYSIDINVTFGTNVTGMELYIGGSSPIAISNGTQTVTYQSQYSGSTVDMLLVAHSSGGSTDFSVKSIEVEETFPAHLDYTYAVNYAADYFPYGKVLREYTNSNGQERYLTTQHERDKETGLDYRGARYYDSDISRFLSIDPWQDKYPEWSTYNYCMGNPILFIDPTGKGVEYTKEVAEAMAKRGKENGYKTEVVENPDQAGDYGVNYSKTVNGTDFEGVQYEGTFEGITGGGLQKYSGSSKLSESGDANNSSQTKDGSNINPAAPITALVGSAKFNALKPVGALGSSRGTSIPSYVLRKALPQTVGTRILGTRVVGGILGRAVPIVGWAWTGVELSVAMLQADTRNFFGGASTSFTGAPLDYTPSICFVAGTKILMADGSEVNIEEVNIGDSVKTYNFLSQNVESSKVLRVDSPVHFVFADLVFENATKSTNTLDHPYFVKGKGWCSVDPQATKKNYGIDATKLVIGDICFYSDGEILIEVKLTSITEFTKKQTSYNLTHVEPNNNFFANRILVHNKYSPNADHIKNIPLIIDEDDCEEAKEEK